MSKAIQLHLARFFHNSTRGRYQPREDIFERYVHLLAAGYTICVKRRKKVIKIVTLKRKG